MICYWLQGAALRKGIGTQRFYQFKKILGVIVGYKLLTSINTLSNLMCLGWGLCEVSLSMGTIAVLSGWAGTSMQFTGRVLSIA